MTGDDSLLFAQCMNQADDVGCEMRYVVRLNCLWRVRLPVSALIGSHDVITRLRELGHLVSPGIPGFRPAMAEDDERPCAFFGQMHADSVALNEAVTYGHEDLQEQPRNIGWADLRVACQQKPLQSAA